MSVDISVSGHTRINNGWVVFIKIITDELSSMQHTLKIFVSDQEVSHFYKNESDMLLSDIVIYLIGIKKFKTFSLNFVKASQDIAFYRSPMDQVFLITSPQLSLEIG